MLASRPMRAAATVAAALVLVAGAAGTADAAKGGGGGKGGGKPPKGGTALTGAAAIQAAHDQTCPVVAGFTSCASLTVRIVDQGDTGWAATASPATRTITYNSHYTATQADWSHVVAHEVGGHVDAWNEIVAAVGVEQAWTDYYDLDHFAQPWAAESWSRTASSARTFSTSDAKEAYLDCRGPVAHGYRGNYLHMWGLTTSTAQRQFCTGAEAVMTAALTQSRP